MSLQAFSDNLSTLSYTSRHRIPLWVYNSKNRSLFGRTATSWFLCLLFYVIFYLCLGGFFMSMMLVFLHTQVPTEHPTVTGLHSLLSLNPGLGFRPNIEAQSSFVNYARTEPESYLPYTQNLDAFFESYKNIMAKPDEQFSKCSDGVKTPDDPEKVCKFSLDQLGDCTSEKKYGYPEGSPCIIIKLNKVYGWIPSIANKSLTSNPLIQCTGQNPADVENMGAVVYNPGFSHEGKQYGIVSNAYFPYLGQKGYLSPVVGVQFKSIKKNVALLLECELFNLKDSASTRFTFEMMVR